MINFLDLLFCVLIVWAGYQGFRKGLIIELSTLVALIGGLYLGIKFSDLASNFIKDTVGFESEFLAIIAFSMIFVVVIVLVFWTGKNIERLLKLILLNFVNKLIGGVFGLLKGAIFIGAILTVITAYQDITRPLTGDVIEKSLLYRPLAKLSTTVIPALKNSSLFEQGMEELDKVESPL